MEAKEAGGIGVSIKDYIIGLVENNTAILYMLLLWFNKIQADKNCLSASNIHFRSNEIVVTRKKNNHIVFGKKAYLRDGKIYVNGGNNHIEVQEGAVIYGDSVSQIFHVDGNNNRIIVGANCRINQTTFFIWGSNNTIILGDNCSTMGLELHIEQDNNTIQIGNGSTFHGRNGYPIHIAVDEGSRVVIAEDCMFANGIQIRSTDSHSIVDLNGKRINPAKDIYIGEHCWIGLGAIILKDSEIMPHTVVAAGAICSKKYRETNCILAGNPAKVVKREVDWDRKFL